MENDERKNAPRESILHCPICGRELDEEQRTAEGWECRCGEFIPASLALDSQEGCTHGRNCNCGREMRF
ncbi:MAG: hypothetical protein P8Y66_05695 [Nitrospirota bacterium]|jgi:hypothetical protein